MTISRRRVKGCDVGSRGSWEVDLEWTSKWFHITQEFEERMIILGTSPNEIHSIAVGNTKLDVLAAVIEALAKLFSDKEVGRLDSGPAIGTLLCRGDIDKFALVWGACKGTKE